MIVAQVITDRHVDDAGTGKDLIAQVDGPISRLTADTAYDARPVYDAGVARGATVVVPPRKTAAERSRPRCPARDATIARVKEVGLRQWKKESGYHQQARVENSFFRYKLIIGDRLRAQHPKAQEAEARIACNILNRMTELGRPVSYSIGA